MNLLAFDKDDGVLRKWEQFVRPGLVFEGFNSLNDGLERLSTNSPQIVVLDQSASGLALPEMVAECCDQYRMHIFVATAPTLPPHVVSLMKSNGLAWAFGKPLCPKEINTGLQSLVAIAHRVTERYREFEQIHTQFLGLTHRERQVLNLVLDGTANREAAQELSISVRTVESRRAKVYKKLEVDNLVDLVRKYDRWQQLQRRFTPPLVKQLEPNITKTQLHSHLFRQTLHSPQTSVNCELERADQQH